jgi:hypothetical protein
MGLPNSLWRNKLPAFPTAPAASGRSLKIDMKDLEQLFFEDVAALVDIVFRVEG